MVNFVQILCTRAGPGRTRQKELAT